MAKQSYTSGQVLTSSQMQTLQTNDFNQTVSTKTVSYTLVAADVGTNVEMNAAGATSITANTSLFAAGDTLILSNKGAGVCTVTAGTATVATAGVLTMNQNERGTLYFISASAAIWYGSTGSGGDLTALTAGSGISITSPTGPVPTVAIDATVATLTGSQTLTNKTLTSPALTTPTISTLTTNGDLVYGTGSGALAALGIGSSAQVLSVSSGLPSWQTPTAASSDFVKISSVAWTAASAQSLTSVFSATYDNYCIVLDNMMGSSVNDLCIRMRSGGSNDTNSTYYYANVGLGTNATGYNTNSNGTNTFVTQGLTETPHKCGLIMWMFNPFEAVRTSTVWTQMGATATEFAYNTGGGIFAADTSFDGLGFFCFAGGNLQGDATVYGLKK